MGERSFYPSSILIVRLLMRFSASILNRAANEDSSFGLAAERGIFAQSVATERHQPLSVARCRR